jgi:hypothetical protein
MSLKRYKKVKKAYLSGFSGSLGVRGSIPLSSTKINKAGHLLTGFFYFDEGI